MSKLELADDGALIFNCPGCNMPHEVYPRPLKNSKGASWQWNGDPCRPTFTPSINVRMKSTVHEKPDKVCHSFVTNGRIQFLNDCTHHLIGQTVDLPEAES